MQMAAHRNVSNQRWSVHQISEISAMEDKKNFDTKEKHEQNYFTRVRRLSVEYLVQQEKI